MELLKKVVQSMGEMCKKTGVKIITGDTKVVEKGSVDGLFINTSGIGIVNEGYRKKSILEGDKVIVTGGIGEHGTAIAIQRYNLNFKSNLVSDCMPLNKVIEKMERYAKGIKLI